MTQRDGPGGDVEASVSDRYYRYGGYTVGAELTELGAAAHQAPERPAAAAVDDFLTKTLIRQVMDKSLHQASI